MSLKLSRFIARGLQRYDGDTAKFTRANLDLCFPELSEDERDEMVLESLTHMCLLFFEIAQITHWPEDRLFAQIDEVVGREQMDKAVAEGKGVMLLAPHYGSWEILCAFLGRNYGIAALYDRPKLAGLEAVILAARERFGAELFPIDTGGMRSLYKALKRGDIIGILPDQVPDPSGGVHVEFFGHPALTMTLAHRIVSRSNPAVVMGLVRRRLEADGYRYQLVFERLEDLSGEDATACTRAINAAIERAVRVSPAQYQWEYKRFKRPPGGGKHPAYMKNSN